MQTLLCNQSRTALAERSRRYNLYRILVLCRKNKWTHDTPNLAGKLESLLGSSGYTERTIRDYVRTAVNMLEFEKKHDTDLVLEYELENFGRKRSAARKETKSRERARDNPIYSSPFVPSIDETEISNSESTPNPNFVYIN